MCTLFLYLLALKGKKKTSAHKNKHVTAVDRII